VQKASLKYFLRIWNTLLSYHVFLVTGKTLLSLRARVCHPCTCTRVRLLGPCYKTGRWVPSLPASKMTWTRESFKPQDIIENSNRRRLPTSNHLKPHRQFNVLPSEESTCLLMKLFLQSLWYDKTFWLALTQQKNQPKLIKYICQAHLRKSPKAFCHQEWTGAGPFSGSLPLF